MFQLSTICKRGFGTKIMFFTYGFTTFIGKKFIDSCSLGLRQMAAKLYRSAERNKAYKAIPSLLLPHPPRGRHTFLPPTLSRPSSVQKMRYAGLNFVLQARETETKNWTFRVFENPSRCGPGNRRKVLLYMVLIFCTRPSLASYTFCTGHLGVFF